MFLVDYTRPSMIHNVLRMHAVATVHERERDDEKKYFSRLPLPLNFGTICVPSSSFPPFSAFFA